MGKMILENGVLKNRPIVKRHHGLVQKNPPLLRKRTGPSLDDVKKLIEKGSSEICIIRSLGGIGDVLMSTPALRAIKHEWPNSNLTYATDFKYLDGSLEAILTNNPYIDNLVPHYSIRGRKFDFLIDITSVCIGTEKAGGTIRNRIDIFADHMGVSLAESGHLPDYIVTQEEEAWAKEKLSRYISKQQKSLRIGIQARASTISRSWPIERVRELAIRLSKQLGVQVFIFDSSYGGGQTEAWNIADLGSFKDYGIRQVAALLNEMDLVVAPDSGLMHIAGALNKRIVGIFAGTDPGARINYYPNAIDVSKRNYSCFPCWYDQSPCGGRYTCLHTITVDEVLEAVNAHLQRPLISVEDHENNIKEQALKESRLASGAKIAICRDKGGYGDIICLTSAVRDLKESLPKSNITIVCPEKYHCVFDGNPDVNKRIEKKLLKKTDYDKLYDLTAADSYREVRELARMNKVVSTRPQIYIYATGGNANNIANLVPKLYLSDEEREWVRERVIKKKEYTYIVTPLSTAELYRDWRPENYLDLFKLVQKKHKDWRFVLVATNRFEDKLPKNVVDATGYPFRRLMSIVEASDIVLTPDTSVLHIAAAFSKPCVALFGPIDDLARCKYYPTARPVIKKNMDCVPCWRNATSPCKHPDASDGYSYCMDCITPVDVLEALEEKIEAVGE